MHAMVCPRSCLRMHKDAQAPSLAAPEGRRAQALDAGIGKRLCADRPAPARRGVRGQAFGADGGRHAGQRVSAGLDDLDARAAAGANRVQSPRRTSDTPGLRPRTPLQKPHAGLPREAPQQPDRHSGRRAESAASGQRGLDARPDGVQRPQRSVAVRKIAQRADEVSGVERSLAPMRRGDGNGIGDDGHRRSAPEPRAARAPSGCWRR